MSRILVVGFVGWFLFCVALSIVFNTPVGGVAMMGCGGCFVLGFKAGTLVETTKEVRPKKVVSAKPVRDVVVEEGDEPFLGVVNVERHDPY